MNFSYIVKNYILMIVTLSIFLLSLVYFWKFSAEDSYIVARYAYNLVNFGELAYNIEVPISALTSPLHALLESLLLLIFKYDPVYLWKLFSVGILLSSVYLYSRLFKDMEQKILFSIMVLLSPLVLIWTVGGLETILLFFFIGLFLFTFVNFDVKNNNIFVLLIIIFSLAFITRFDSIIFFLPFLLYITYSRGLHYSNIFLLIIGLLPIIIWFLFALYYYDSFLPTSFYVKTPSVGISNIFVVLRGLIWSGIPIILVYLILAKQKIETCNDKEKLMILASILIFLYGCTMASKHMMFSFRSLIPYLPVLFYLIIKNIKEIRYFLLYILILFQSFQLFFLYNGGINFYISHKIEQNIFSNNFADKIELEYANVTLLDYIKFMDTLQYQAKLISIDTKNNEKHLKSVVLTYAEGIPSFIGINEYYQGLLVSPGACKKPDYIMDLKNIDINGGG